MRWISFLALALGIGLISLGGTADQALAKKSTPKSTTAAAAESRNVVQLTRIGHPIWKPVDFHLFSAPIGTAADGYAEFTVTQQAVLPPPHHVLRPQDLGIAPGAPHAPPYDTEVAAGVAHQGYHEGGSFKPAEFSNGNGVWLVWMNVPNPGTTGSSPDFASGPIIPNSLFPIHIQGVAKRDSKLFDPFLTNANGIDVPALDGQLQPPFSVDGHSHFPMFITDNMDFSQTGPQPQGEYEYQMTMHDQGGQGWSIVARFAVTGKPS